MSENYDISELEGKLEGLQKEDGKKQRELSKARSIQVTLLSYLRKADRVVRDMFNGITERGGLSHEEDI